MGATNFSGPLYVGGMLVGAPVIPGIRGGLPGGDVLYVGNRSGLSTGDGKSADAPLASLFGANGALARLRGVANSGAVIYVLPGHAENITAADFASDMGAASGFSIVGLGTGTMRPSLTWTAAAATFLLDTNNVEIANFQLFLAGPHAAGTALTVAAPITVSGDGCRIVNCDIWWGFDADQIVNQGIIVTGDDFAFINNRCLAETAAAPTATFMTLTGADRANIQGNYISGPTSGTTVGVIRGLTTLSANLNVTDNYMANTLASSTIAFSPLASSTGEFARNMFFVNSGILPITSGIGVWHQNYCVDTAGQAGALVGTAST